MRKIRSEDEIYNALEKALQGAPYPMTAPELMENPDVRAVAIQRFGNDIQITTNKVSDTLGFMWRRDVLKRFNAPEDSRHRARFSYSLTPQVQTPPSEVPRPSSPSLSSGKPKVTVTESDGKVTIDYENVTIVIKSK